MSKKTAQQTNQATLDALVNSQNMLKQLQKQLYFNEEHNVSVLIKENQQILDEIMEEQG